MVRYLCIREKLTNQHTCPYEPRINRHYYQKKREKVFNMDFIIYLCRRILWYGKIHQSFHRCRIPEAWEHCRCWQHDPCRAPSIRRVAEEITHQMHYFPRLFADSKNKSYICSGIALNDKMPMNVTIINNIGQYFMTQPVKKAWLFGSFSRGEETADSDVDIFGILTKMTLVCWSSK